MKGALKALAVLAIIAGGFVGAFYASGLGVEDPKDLQAIQTVKMHYVPVARYFSELENVTKDDLLRLSLSGDLYLETGEKNNIASILGKGFIDVPEIELNSINEAMSDNKVAIIKWSSVNSGMKSLAYEGDFLWELDESTTYGLSANIEGAESEFNQEQVSRLVFAGDVMLSRTVAKKMRTFGELSPWESVVGFLKGADISFLNLEVPFSDRYSPPTSGMSFIAPTEYAQGLTYSGVDVVSVANNHSANFGRAVFEDNLKTLALNEVNACGGGLTDTEAREVSVVESGGVKFGFLCYNSVIGGLESSNSSSGVATLEIEPWYRDKEADIERVEEDIKKAKEKVAFLIVSPHWGVEYRHYPNNSQQEVAHRMIDAGADLVIGTHPHVVQGSEYYKGKYITYSLGNFIFDQEWSLATKQGAALEVYVYGNKQVSAKLHPIEISNYYKPDFLTGNKKEDVLETILGESIGLN